jgi:hypothetical protein
LLEPSFKESIGEDKLNLGHMIDNGALGGLLFRSVNGMGVAGGKVRTAVRSDERKGDRIFRKEMV